ncbi:alkane 1-monooxygenase [Sedimentimonas flavescens]|uniref:alkane 1-monooxygenase n=1 Tax=Sedimentimonas flavescens TaxID=2851012 RepID=UPI002E2CFB3B|nr:alkane 1-monooxygenase [Sedimentimonas flavescens]
MTTQTDPTRSPGPLSSLARLGRATPGVDLFALVTLAPIPLLLLGAFLGGAFVWVALIYMTVLIFALDEIIVRASPDAPEGTEFPAADKLSIALGCAHFVLLGVAVAAVSGATGLGWGARAGLFWAFGLFFGQVSNSNAHELIHRANARLFQLGKWVYISLLFGHHTSAHRLVHHRFVATPDDPNTAALGEGFWSFFTRAWGGSFIAGYEMERTRIASATQQDGARRMINPYVGYVLGGLWFLLIAGLTFGLAGVLAYLALCLYAQLQLLLSDYVQHYGLERARIDEVHYEPVDIRHSWDARQPVSALWMLNAPRHSDHHAHPARAYPALRLGDTRDKARPMLPYSLPVMATLALIPTLWRRTMDRKVRTLRKHHEAARTPLTS